MNKFYRILLGLTLVLGSSLQSSQIHEITHAVTPQNTAFAFDMHHTLVVPNIQGMMAVAIKRGGFKLAKLITLLPFDAIRYLITGQGSQATFIHNLYKLGFKSPGGAYQDLINSYDPELWKVAEQMATTMTIIPGMKELTSELKDLGYSLRVASNGSSWEVNGMAKRWPQLFDNFQKDSQTVEYGVATPKKPDLAYYTDYLSKFDQGKRVIFIDDKQENVDAANEAGMIGILFKDAAQLRAGLKKMGIALK